MADKEGNANPKPFAWPPHFPWDQKAGPGTTVGRPDDDPKIPDATVHRESHSEMEKADK